MLNKLDLIPEEERKRRIEDFLRAYGAAEETPCFPISALSGDGCRPLILALQTALDELPPPVAIVDDPADDFFSDTP